MRFMSVFAGVVLVGLTACQESSVSYEKVILEEDNLPTTVILVRHAEKNNETDTSTLTTAGYERAERLATMLAPSKIDAIYTTPFVRMKLTAQPTADQKKLSLQEYKPNQPEEIDNIIQTNIGKTVLIVGHGNAIPGIVNKYCGTNLPEKLEGYTDFFLLTITDHTSAENPFLHLGY